MVHVDRVRHLSLADQEVIYDSNSEQRSRELVGKTNDTSTPSRAISDADKSVEFNPPFSDYIEDVRESDEDEIADNVTDDRQAASPPALAQRVTRAFAQNNQVQVRDIPLPRHCHASKQGRNK